MGWPGRGGGSEWACLPRGCAADSHGQLNVSVLQRGRDALQAALLTESGDVNWPRLTNLLGNDDALRDAAKENAARAEEAILASASHEERYEELHMDAAEEAKRVVQELMVSCEVCTPE